MPDTKPTEAPVHKAAAKKDDALHFRPNFSGHVNLADKNITFVEAGCRLADALTGKDLVLADGEEDRLRALGAFDEGDTHPRLIVDRQLVPVVLPGDKAAQAALYHGHTQPAGIVSEADVARPDES